MDNNGKKYDVLVLDISYDDPKTGMRVNSETMIDVWANEGLNDFIKKIPGVSPCFNNHEKCHYLVYLDPRYDKEFVKKEIEAQILCR